MMMGVIDQTPTTRAPTTTQSIPPPLSPTTSEAPSVSESGHSLYLDGFHEDNGSSSSNYDPIVEQDEITDQQVQDEEEGDDEDDDHLEDLSPTSRLNQKRKNQIAAIAGEKSIYLEDLMGFDSSSSNNNGDDPDTSSSGHDNIDESARTSTSVSFLDGVDDDPTNNTTQQSVINNPTTRQQVTEDLLKLARTNSLNNTRRLSTSTRSSNTTGTSGGSSRSLNKRKKKKRSDDRRQGLLDSSDRRQGLLDSSHRSSLQARRSDISYTLDAENIRPALKEKIKSWLISFYRLDPRYKILKFFNQVASEGADQLIDDDGDDCIYGQNSIRNLFGDSVSERLWKANGGDDLLLSSDDDELSHSNSFLSMSNRSQTVRNSLLSSIFNATSILTVWRPCSNEAMKRMILCEGVGKGLDIKGKSAKQGLLSAFVPFMQIHENSDKFKIAPLKDSYKMRIYFYSDESRQECIDTIIENNIPQSSSPKPHAGSSSSIVVNPIDDIELIDDYGESTKGGRWGIEISQKLFWDCLILPQDISRNKDTETGRPSLPGFQDANMKTLKCACQDLEALQQRKQRKEQKQNSDDNDDNELDFNDLFDVSLRTNKQGDDIEEEDKPVAVVLQYDKLNACKAQTFVMAYEESGTVTPVVSDFDNFLLGWRREALWFGCNLPQEQEDLMMWSIDHIENLLKEQQQREDNANNNANNTTNNDGDVKNNEQPSTNDDNTSWTVKWLDILMKESRDGFVPKIPEYGFGDPKSYGIMEKAALKLKDTGAVRHGSECFNYYFPQEMDDYFLIVSDTFRPVPWKYVTEKELQSILIRKIKEGFVFPLNPKWVLCDPGWKNVYDEIMKSDALYAGSSRDVWFPPSIGILDRIEDICAKYPEGFKGPKKKEEEQLSMRTIFQLAVLELENFNERSKKMELAKAMQRTNKSTRRGFQSCISLGSPILNSPKKKLGNTLSPITGTNAARKMLSTPSLGSPPPSPHHPQQARFGFISPTGRKKKKGNRKKLLQNSSPAILEQDEYEFPSTTPFLSSDYGPSMLPPPPPSPPPETPETPTPDVTNHKISSSSANSTTTIQVYDIDDTGKNERSPKKKKSKMNTKKEEEKSKEKNDKQQAAKSAGIDSAGRISEAPPAPPLSPTTKMRKGTREDNQTHQQNGSIRNIVNGNNNDNIVQRSSPAVVPSRNARMSSVTSRSSQASSSSRRSMSGFLRRALRVSKSPTTEGKKLRSFNLRRRQPRSGSGGSLSPTSRDRHRDDNNDNQGGDEGGLSSAPQPRRASSFRIPRRIRPRTRAEFEQRREKKKVNKTSSSRTTIRDDPFDVASENENKEDLEASA